MTPIKSIEALVELRKIGLTDQIFNIVHHYRENEFISDDDTISAHISYCENVKSFQAGGNNQVLSKRLCFILETYRAWKLPPNQTEVLIALARAAYLGIRTCH